MNSTILLASATTIAGILSLGVTTLRLTREFAVATSFGIFACALLSFLFFPAFLAILKPPKEKHAELVLAGTLSRVMEGLGRTVYRFRVLLVVIALGIVLVFGLLAGKLEYNTDTISYFPGHDRVIQDMYAITDKLGGFDELKVVLHAPGDEQNYFLDAEVLEPVSRLEEELEGYPDISYVSSFVSYLKYLNQVMYGSYGLPEKRSLILLLSRYLKTLQGGDVNPVLSGIIDPEGTTLTLSLRIFNSSTGRFVDERGVRRILAFLEQSIGEIIPGEIDTEIQGISLKYLALSDMIREDLLSSMLISLAAVFAIAALAYRSLKFGIFTLIPLFIGIMMNFILMVLFRIPLDLLTIMVSSIVIGVGVDDAIHFIIRFRQEWKGGPVTPEVLSRTLQVSGRPIFLTTVSIVGGLAVLLFASFKPIVYFGVLVLISLSATCIGTLLFLPAFLSFMKGRR